MSIKYKERIARKWLSRNERKKDEIGEIGSTHTIFSLVKLLQKFEKLKDNEELHATLTLWQ